MSIVDKENFKAAIKDYPDQFFRALDFAKHINFKEKFDNIIICGLGGSALPADMTIAYLRSKNITFPIIVNRTYNLPIEASKKSLIIASSYSGNTEETTSCLKEAIKRKLKIIGVSKGGDVEKICFKHNLPHIKYPDDGPLFQPRCATGYSFTTFTMILSKLGVIRGAKQEIEKLATFLKKTNQETKGKNLAQKIKGKIPIVYTSDFYKDSIARIFKIKFNENSKTQSFYNYFPELNHNEMVGYTNVIGRYYCIILQDPDDHPRVIKRMKITKDILAEKGIEAEIIKMKGKTTLEKIFSTNVLADWASYYLALEYKQDPTPVAMVEEFKDLMKK